MKPLDKIIKATISAIADLQEQLQLLEELKKAKDTIPQSVRSLSPLDFESVSVRKKKKRA